MAIPRPSVTWEQHRGARQGHVPLCLWDTEAWRHRTHQVRLEREAEPGDALMCLDTGNEHLADSLHV